MLSLRGDRQQQLIVGVLKYFLFFGGFVCCDFYSLGLLSYGAFVHFGFSLFTHVIAWRECWLSTSVSCDHMNRNWLFEYMYLNILSFWGFCPHWILSFRAFVLWCFCPFLLFSVRQQDHMTRMFKIHTCITLSHEQKWDRTPWLLEY